ncbi:MAG: flagellar biosynthetic protein FliR [Planctomycetes bacterium]|nr:flagellar biosynthetic protein FliR [Planctomycetota bacterium]
MLENGTLAAFGLYLVRTSAFVLGLPFFGGPTTFGGAKIGWIASLSLLLFSVHGVPLPEAEAPFVFGALAVREVLVGVALSFVLVVVMLGVRVAGEMIGSEMAFNMATVVDPAGGGSTPVIAQFYEMMFFLGLLAVDGHHLLLRALSGSFERAPVGVVSFAGGFADVAVGMTSDLIGAGITFAAPVLILLFLSSIVIGLIARVVPQSNVMELSFSIRIMVGLGAMLLFAPLLAPGLAALYERLDVMLERVLTVLEG